VWPDIVGQHGKAAIDRLEGDPAIPLEQFAPPRLALAARRPLSQFPVVAIGGLIGAGLAAVFSATSWALNN
jgi:hypothetical protein